MEAFKKVLLIGLSLATFQLHATPKPADYQVELPASPALPPSRRLRMNNCPRGSSAIWCATAVTCS